LVEPKGFPQCSVRGVVEISVAVPCYNEIDVIELFHSTLLGTLTGITESFEICYVDDGSSDGTRERLRAFAAADPRVRYVSFSRNFGKEAAVLAALRMCVGQAAVLMDGDLQHPPELIGRMAELWRQGHDQVVARRDRQGEGLVRRTLSRLYYRLAGRYMDVELTDGVGDFRLLSRKAVDAILSLPESNRFSKGIFSWIGFETVCFDYTNSARAGGRSKWGGKSLLNYGVDGLISFNNKPLRMAIHVGISLAVAALCYAVWTICGVLVHGVDTPGYATIIAVVVGLGGIQLVTLGVVGEYVGRIYRESKKRPHYVVRESSETDPPRAGISAKTFPLGAPLNGGSHSDGDGGNGDGSGGDGGDGGGDSDGDGEPAVSG
jgi:polyisoprenyl-phosphate glycosyltransferase